MLVDGKKIAEEIYAEIRSDLRQIGEHPCLIVFTAVPNAETRKYMELKKKRASELGIDLVVVEFDASIDTDKAVLALESYKVTADGIIIQLPFPHQVDTERLLSAIPKDLDVDNINYQGEATDILPPVVGAIAEITKRHKIDFLNKNVVVVGSGRLVGKPAKLWALTQGAKVTVIDKHTANADEILRQADIIISGAGVAGLITPDKIKDGVVIFDAGTSEEGGEIRGDSDPSCVQKASLFTPTPGGIGPITIAVLLKNLVNIYR